MKARITEIYIAPEAGAPMQKVQDVHAIAGVGLQGDRYASSEGFWQTVPKTRDTVRHVTLISREAIQEANAEFGTHFDPIDTRRNLVVEGIENLMNLIDQEFQFGEVRMRGIEECTPCKRPSDLSAKSNFSKAFKPNGRGGLRAEILTSGVIRQGDEMIFTSCVDFRQ